VSPFHRLPTVTDRYPEGLNEHADEEPPLTPAERVQLAEAQRELRELRMENEFLKKAAAYFARDPR
jgi:transposase-like protein